MEGGHLAALGPERKGGRRLQERRRLCQRPDDADPAPRRHRAGALRQDRVHHRAGAQPGVRRTPALFRGHGRGAHRAGLSRAAARRHPAALRLRGAPGRARRRPAAMAREHAAHQPAARHRRVQLRPRSSSARSARVGCISISSTIPANGCSTCRCWISILPSGRRGRSPRRSRRIARTPRASGCRFWPPSMPTAPADEQKALTGAQLFTRYLQSARAPDALLTAPGPGRFLLPGDLAGSPLLTFFPLPLPTAPARRAARSPPCWRAASTATRRTSCSPSSAITSPASTGRSC